LRRSRSKRAPRFPARPRIRSAIRGRRRSFVAVPSPSGNASPTISYGRRHVYRQALLIDALEERRQLGQFCPYPGPQPALLLFGDLNGIEASSGEVDAEAAELAYREADAGEQSRMVLHEVFRPETPPCSSSLRIASTTSPEGSHFSALARRTAVMNMAMPLFMSRAPRPTRGRRRSGPRTADVAISGLSRGRRPRVHGARAGVPTGARDAYDQVRALRISGYEPRFQANGCQRAADVGNALHFVTGRVRCIEPQQLLKELDRPLVKRRRRA
jgi:hypothetical protein